MRRPMLGRRGALALPAAALGGMLVPGSGRAVPAPVVPPPPAALFTGKPIDLFEYGNSFTARGFAAGTPPSSALQTSLNGLSPMLEAMSGGALRIKNPVTMMAGNNGKTSTFLAQNFAAQVAPKLGSFDWLVMWGWAVNDLPNGITPAQSLTNVQSIFAACQAAGKVLLLGTPYFTRLGSYAPTVAQGEVMAATNRLVATWARNTAGVLYFDFWNDIVDPAQTLAAAYANVQDSDNLHPASLGVQVVAARCLAAIAPFLTGVGQPNAQLDAFDAANNPGGNLFSTLAPGGMQLQGTGGTFSTGSGAGVGGQLPTGWNAFRSAGTDPITCAKVAAVPGFGSEGGDAFTVGVANPAANCAAGLQVYLACPAALVGKPVEALLDVILPANAAGLADLTWGIFPQYQYGSVWGLRADALAATYWRGEQRLVIRTPPLTVPAGTGTFQLQLNPSFLAGCNAAFTFARPVLRLVAQ